MSSVWSRTGRGLCISYVGISGVCELTNQSRVGIQGAGLLKRQELKQRVSERGTFRSQLLLLIFFLTLPDFVRHHCEK